MKINEDIITSLANLTAPAIRHGNELEITETATLAVGLLTASVLANTGGCCFVPFLTLLNVVMLALSNRKKTPWDDMRPKIEAMINHKVQQYHLDTIHSQLRGLIENLGAVRLVYKQFNEAPPQNRERQGELLRLHHNALLMFLRASIPHYQMERHAVVSLPDFALAATIQIMMLGDALKNGLAWGYTPEFLRAIRDDFNAKTGLGTKINAVPKRTALTGTSAGIAPRAIGHGLQMQLLSDTIRQGEAEGWSAELIDTWKQAYSALSVQRRDVSSGAGEEVLDYPTYVEQTYEHGRTLVNPPKPGQDLGPGSKVAAAMRALADYDSIMTIHVMTYAEYWPYITGEYVVPDSVLRSMDREVFAGPYGRWADRVPWSKTHPAPVRPRSGNITSLMVLAGESIDGFRQASGGRWGAHYGSSSDGLPYRINLGPNEIIENIEVTYGEKVGSLVFISNKARYGPYGSPRHTTTKPKKWKQALLHNATLGLSVNRTGYGLSSVHCTRWTGGAAAGCEGIYFGFRPLYIADDEHEPVQNYTNAAIGALANWGLT
ncbi:hypothetical protein BB8028_0002g00110 [Beauveria bassiana]|uniref:Uncharacterized protein n=1 Tax=Beauveria bassiana TaxID=176275 RepID=A0A2S7Y0K2_BEABA|nr:hypothetical protein BB8028_0002g00110 [Beauveria bassiana]